MSVTASTDTPQYYYSCAMIIRLFILFIFYLLGLISKILNSKLQAWQSLQHPVLVHVLARFLYPVSYVYGETTF